MGFWKVFKKIGAAVLPVGRLVARHTPVGPIIEDVLDVVEAIEAAGPGKGAYKRELAVEMLLRAMQAGEALAGRELYDEKKLAAALGPLIDSAVSYFNAVEWKKGK